MAVYIAIYAYILYFRCLDFGPSTMNLGIFFGNSAANTKARLTAPGEGLVMIGSKYAHMKQPTVH